MTANVYCISDYRKTVCNHCSATFQEKVMDIRVSFDLQSTVKVCPDCHDYLEDYNGTQLVGFDRI